jgi:putative membrane protein
MRPIRVSSRVTVVAAAAVSIIALGACSKQEAPPADTATAAAAPAPAPADPGLNDAQIAHIVVTADAIDSTAGALAAQKGSSKDVKDFGKMMVTDHGAVNKQAVALATKLNVTPEDNDVSRSLKTGGDANLTKLQGLTGNDFDKAYIDNEVAYHQAVADALTQKLIPGAQNAELKALLEKSLPAFGAHLERAKQIQASLNK